MENNNVVIENFDKSAVNAVIADLKSDKASIKLVETAEISDPASNVIYLHKVDDVVTEKVYINGNNVLDGDILDTEAIKHSGRAMKS
mgnify:CR=1 FL=1